MNVSDIKVGNVILFFPDKGHGFNGCIVTEVDFLRDKYGLVYIKDVFQKPYKFVYDRKTYMFRISDFHKFNTDRWKIVSSEPYLHVKDKILKWMT